MRLYIAEKASLGKAIADALGNLQKEAPSALLCNGGKDLVTWAAGHILRLAQPHEINPDWKTWSLDQLPMLPGTWKKLPLDDNLPKLKTIERYLPRASEVINAGDADREGQLLVDEILEYLGYAGPVKRLLITDTTPDAIRRSIAGMKDNAEYASLRDSALARERTDWLLGMNMSRLYTLRGQAAGGHDKISLGRVQTPTLGLIVNRDKEIENFVPAPYWQIRATLATPNGEFDAVWQPKDGQAGLDEEGRLVQEDVADTLLKSLSGGKAVIQAVRTEKKTTHPPLPHSLPTLQIACNKKYDLPAAKTLEILQHLYEAGITTYPRSDCQYLPAARAADAPQILSTISALCPEFHAAISAADITRRTAAWNDKKVSEHFAIIPTGKIDRLTDEERQVFVEVARQYLAQFLGDHVYLATQILSSIGNENFKSAGRQILESGWRSLFTAETEDENQDEPNNVLPLVTDGESLPVVSLDKIGKKTAPPKHFTEATLLQAMNGIHKYVTDPEIRKTLREVDGIGTAATQALIIEKILSRGYAGKVKKSIMALPLGKTLIASVSHELSAPDLTAVMEQRAKMIHERQLSLDDYMTFIMDLVQKLVLEARTVELNIIPTGKGVLCTVCNSGNLVQRNGPYGLYWLCQNPECRATFDDKKGSPAKPVFCPLCKSLMRRWKRKSAVGHYWLCTNKSCGLLLNDDRGHPQKAFPCPGCGKGVLRLMSGKHGPFWGCSNRECHRTCKDVDGKPQL